MFEWDERKRLRNLEEHGVDFRRAVQIFDDAVLEAPDTRRSYGETRFLALGHVEDEYYMVVYTWRGQARRIISAWKVGNDGRRRYQTLLS
jgi:hypothetical protein